MANIQLTQELVKEFLNYYNGFLYWKKVKYKSNRPVGSTAGCFCETLRYYNIKFNRKNYLYHQIIFLWHYGYIPKEIDHKDRDKKNNRIENLRDCTHSENAVNMSSVRSQSGYYGVHKMTKGRKWQTVLRHNSKSIYIGYYYSKEQAALEYNKVAVKLHGEFAKLNIIKPHVTAE